MRGIPPTMMVDVVTVEELRRPCMDPTDPYRRFLDTSEPYPLTPRQKGVLALRDLIDPFNFITIAGNSAVSVAADSHSAYGPGMRGFGRNLGYSYLGDATSEFLGTFLICSLTHQDPHYHRMPSARPMRRVWHAIGRTVLAQHDDGRTMPNYENLINYTAGNLLANLYVPGVHTNASATVQRIGVGLATDPINNLVTEFLPDVARRVHVRAVFVQRILNSAIGEKELE